MFAKTKNAIGTHQFFQLRFLCEKTLLPVDGHDGYELKMSSEGLRKFLETAGPILGATCAILKLVATVARPLAKVVGVEDYVPTFKLDLTNVREIECGTTTVGELFKEQLDQIESFGKPNYLTSPRPSIGMPKLKNPVFTKNFPLTPRPSSITGVNYGKNYGS